MIGSDSVIKSNRAYGGVDVVACCCFDGGGFSFLDFLGFAVSETESPASPDFAH